MIDKKKPVFRVIFSVEPAIRIGKARSYKFEFGELVFKENIHSEMGVAKGLLIYATVNSPDIETAISRTRGVVIRVLAMFSFLTAASIPNPRILKCYDITSSRQEGKFVQYNYVDFLKPISVRQGDFTELNISLNSISTQSESHQDRFFRAMHWYRLAFQSEDILDRFTLIWIGLETLNPLLEMYSKLEPKFRNFDGQDVDYDKCPTCGHKTLQALDGVDQLLNEVAADDVFLREVKNLRRKTLHGFGQLKDITPKTKVLLPKLTLAFDTGLRILLGLPKRSELKPLNLRIISPIYYRTNATIKGPDLELLDEKVIPSIDMDFVAIGFKPGAQGYKIDKVVETIDSKFTFNDIQDYRSQNEAVGLRFEDTPHTMTDD